VGLSGVGYGLFGFLWVLNRKDPRFADVVDRNTVALFLGWFVLCCVLTATNVWKVGNVAHAVGAALGSLVGFAVIARGLRRIALAAAVAGSLAATLLIGAFGRSYVNLAHQAGPELAYFAYLDLVKGHNEAAARQYQRAVELESQEADWWYNLGIA